ncbi:MAG: ATP synthase F1 subunit gamma [Christensenellaceae bacterium]|jgi:F-type H+-transporting ATPase subunit gamma|nr:ATP synthase F1 subunit gamma [Christensenellaceae bacterium]
MSSVQEIRHHISAVTDTSKITRAMYLISSAKMKRAMSMYEQNHVYSQKVRSVIRFLLENTDDGLTNPYFRQHPGKRAAFLVIAADKGLCGGYNAEILKLAQRTIEGGDFNQRFLFTVGYVASEHFARVGLNPDVHYLHIIQDPNLGSAREITYELCELFRSKHLDEVYVVYTELLKGQLIPRVARLLPILERDFITAEILHEHTGNLIYHPSSAGALDEITHHYLIGIVYSTLVQSFASEQRARMTAMEAATQNADEMLADLKLELNHARQAAITQELTEIISGSSQ